MKKALDFLLERTFNTLSLVGAVTWSFGWYAVLRPGFVFDPSQPSHWYTKFVYLGVGSLFGFMGALFSRPASPPGEASAPVVSQKV